ncbi:TIGR01906 family membrane protein [Pseudoflavonifractor capillosus]|uniref:TIGR01906 family membrane protein n=1 Tax=Pseudoflavonifractor capillosus TaxID=106588 RepID=UPI00195BC60B|nr:TIGR01906 family membrane protein [Pseudoflavonifractor capillosus]MBM6896113.1 TIGR01906 family membrane protein [Pseudoflavonifractor capillosus]
MKQSKLLSLFWAVILALVVLTGSIAAPILCRPFYYAHISGLNLSQRVGLSEREIRRAYDEMMDYCTGGDHFSTGILPYSSQGASHFADVRGLFLLDLRLLAASLGAGVVLFVLSRVTKRRCAPILGRGPGFWAGVGLGGSFALVGVLASLDFNRAFVIFHQLFFPGKDNWLFDPATDPIIFILPQEFFRNCALLILGLLLGGCILMIVWDFLRPKARV